MISSGTTIFQPMRVASLGGPTAFICMYAPFHNNIQQFQWIINGKQVEEDEQREGIMVHNDIVKNVGHLFFNNISVEYNDTIIQCIVNLTSGDMIESNNATLFIQGEDRFIT